MIFSDTPFIGYRYEDIHESLNEYFIEPQCFESLISTRPTIIEGSRGFGKTTLLKSIEYKNDYNYFGVYYKVNDNITAHFTGNNFDDIFWIKLFSCYFVLSLTYQLSKLAQSLSKEYDIDVLAILSIGKRFFKTNCNNLIELSDCIFNQKESIIEYLNNGATGEQPYICNYSELIKEFPEAVIMSNSKFEHKTVYYLVDEFENLNVLEQKCVLSFLKQHDQFHTFKIVTKPWGIIEYETIGGQQIQLIHDYAMIDLTKPDILRKASLKSTKKEDFYEFSKKVCNRRIEKFLNKYKITYLPEHHKIECYCQEISYNDELKILLESLKYEEELDILKVQLQNKDLIQYVEKIKQNPIDYCILKLYMDKNSNDIDVVDKGIEFILNQSQSYKDMKDNYKMAFLYKYSDAYNKKFINGFNDMVNFSGGNIRYLLEFCNELFSRLKFDDNYICTSIDIKEQTKAVQQIAKSDLNAIKYSRNIDDNELLKTNAGLKIRSMIIALGNIYNIIHKSPKLSVIEPNHFVVKLTGNEMNDAESRAIRECIMNGYFVAYENNKAKSKNKIVLDEYMYKLHPLYCAYFGISWRQKNNIALTLDQLRKLFSGNSKEVNSVIEHFEKKYKHKNESNSSLDEQLCLLELVDEIQ